VDFRPLTDDQRQQLFKSLRGNAEDNKALMMDRQTTFVGSLDEVPDEEVINAIKSVPCHY
jgi:ribosome recycling factor